MTLAHPSISSFPRDHTFPAAQFSVSAEEVATYLAAVGDAGDYGRRVPPLAAVAFALRALQDSVALPDGSLHTGQEVEHLAIVRADEALTMTARIAQRSERQGMVISVIEIEIATAEAVATRARTTIIAPREGAGGGA